jgi:hypothetical protein
MRRVIEALTGGAIIYVAMAACSAQDSSHSGPVATGGVGGGTSEGGGGNPAGGATAGGGGAVGQAGNDAGDDASRDAARDTSFIDALADALTDPVTEADANVSGTRLRARNLVATDGAVQFQGWHDSQLGIDCVFSPTTNGLRCLPLGSTFPNYFGDAGCSQPLHGETKGCSPPSTVSAYEVRTLTCAGSNIIYTPYRVGSLFTGSVVYQQGGSCVQASAGITDLIDFYGLQALPLTDYVAATEQIE